MNINIEAPISALKKSNVKKKARPVLNKAILNSIDQDQFIKSNIYKNNNLQFKIKPIKFFKENDDEKITNMTLVDKVNSKIKLKNENRYIIA